MTRIVRLGPMFSEKSLKGCSSNQIEKSKMILSNNPLWSYVGQPWVTMVNRGQPWLFRSRIRRLPVTIRLR